MDASVSVMEAANATTERIIGAAIAVHRALGPGLLEKAYERCLALEFEASELRFERQVSGHPVGLILNFHSKVLTQGGVRRLVL